jgi:hypothetical protein
MDPYYVLTSFLHNFKINSQAVIAKINIIKNQQLKIKN